MSQLRFRCQFSLRWMLLVVAATAVPLTWFAPTLRATLIQFLNPAPDVAFNSTGHPSNQHLVWSSFGEMHAHFVNRFVESNGFGAARLLQIDDPRIRALVVNDRPYLVERMELISLNKPHVPFAYVTRAEFAIPMKSNIPNAKRRELSTFEKGAVRKIQVGRDVIYNGDDKQPVLVGSVRATAGCLQCHGANPGDLLGCMTYHLRLRTP